MLERVAVAPLFALDDVVDDTSQTEPLALDALELTVLRAGTTLPDLRALIARQLFRLLDFIVHLMR